MLIRSHYQVFLLILQHNYYNNIEQYHINHHFMRYVQYALFLLLVICGRANAQTSQFPNYNLASRHITINNGLQSNSITSLLQDPDGYIWI